MKEKNKGKGIVIDREDLELLYKKFDTCHCCHCGSTMLLDAEGTYRCFRCGYAIKKDLSGGGS